MTNAYENQIVWDKTNSNFAAFVSEVYFPVAEDITEYNFPMNIKIFPYLQNLSSIHDSIWE